MEEIAIYNNPIHFIPFPLQGEGGTILKRGFAPLGLP
jgi:hypothetical protein